MGLKEEIEEMSFEEAVEQLKRVAKRHEGTKGLLHEIADTLEREHQKALDELADAKAEQNLNDKE